jgi:cysteinyl-tRNA synthetase
VCPDTFKVECIIDWQHTVVTPLLLAAGYPRLFENPEPVHPRVLEPPKYPDGYDTMDPQAKAQADELIRRQSLFYLYRVFNGGLNKLHLSALRDPLFLQRQYVVDIAGHQWSGNLISLRGALMLMRKFWDYFPGKDGDAECPIAFSAEETARQAEQEQMWADLKELVGHWRDELGGLTEEGWVRTEQYDYAVKRNASLKAEFAAGGSADELEKLERGWPFQDREEFF